MVRIPAVAALCVGLSVVGVAASSAQANASPAPGRLGQPSSIELSKAKLQKLLQALPEVAEVGARYSGQFMNNLGNPSPQMREPPKKDIKKMQDILAKHGFNLMQFATYMSTLIATYVSISPQAFDAMIPSLDDPQVEKVLENPSVSAKRKKQLKQQVQAAQKNKSTIRDQLRQLATDQNKKVVRSMLPKVKRVLERVRKQSRGTMIKADG